MAEVKPVFLDSDGVWTPVGAGDTIVTGNLKITEQDAANGVLTTDGAGNVTSALLTNDNVSSSAAIAGSKIDPNFGSQNIYGNGANVSDLNASNLGSGTVPDARFPATLPAVSGANLTALNASNLGSGTVPDARLSSNVALYDAAAPVFSNKLGVATPLSTDTDKAATVGYVTNAINQGIAGLDYKANAKWYTLLPSALSIADLVDAMNAEPAIYTAGDRMVVNFGDPGAGTVSPDLETGIYVVGGSSGSWTLTRSSDFANASDEAGAYVFCANQVDPGAGTYTTLNLAFVVQQQEPNAVVGTDALSFTVYGAGASYTAGDFISISANAIAVRNGSFLVNDGSGNLTVDIGQGLANIDSKIGVSVAFPIFIDGSNNVGLNIDSNTLEVNGNNELAVTGVPEGFKVGPDATNNTVSAGALNTLTAGQITIDGNARDLHYHEYTQIKLSNTGATLNIGSAVYWNGTTVSLASKTDGKTVGLLTYDDASGGVFVSAGGTVAINTSVLVGSPNVGDSLYVGSNGSLCTYASLSSGDYVTKVGRYLGDVDSTGYWVAIAVQEFGIKP